MKTCPFPNSKFGVRNSSGIALVVTLLMLSAITFLAVSFLVLTRTQRESANVSLDVNTAREMSEAAFARAQSQIIARMMAHSDLYNFDYMTAHNFINPGGFAAGVASITNVNYDSYTNGLPMSPSANNGFDWAQNIANLFIDPRPPVFIKTNANPADPYDFRFYVDLNRNGRFETNGVLPYIMSNGLPTTNAIGGILTMSVNGEPEWIGVLQYPDAPHSATNRFVGRYTFVALPVGKMLDYNFIHNYSLGGATGQMPIPGSGPADRFVRDQGVGPWELNLAALLDGADTNIYAGGYINSAVGTPPSLNQGTAFNDAYSFLCFRYNGNYGNPYPVSLASAFGGFSNTASLAGIDEFGYSGSAIYAPYLPWLGTNPTNAPWPGSYSMNNFYDIQDLFDTNKTWTGFVNRLLSAGTNNNSYDRYMFQRLLGSIGYGSIPELQTYVYGDVVTTNPAVQPPTVLRTKVNIDWDNSFQIANGLNTSPTNLVLWTQEPGGALGFFTNAAESLLRSQNFRITNYVSNNIGGVPTLVPSNLSYIHFGVTNIPIYNSTNPSIRYTESIHRMLQLAANIYDATHANNTALQSAAGVTTNLPYPSVFRPIFYATNFGTNRAVYIVGYTNMTTNAQDQLKLPFVDIADATNFNPNGNLWGIPWVVGAVKGLPAFDRFIDQTSWVVTRKLLFRRYPVVGPGGAIFGIPTTNAQYTNQFFIMSITNNFGLSAWNTYMAAISNVPFNIKAMMVATIVLTNEVGFALTNPPIVLTANYSNTYWNGLGRHDPERSTNGILAILNTNVPTLLPAYFSETKDQFIKVFLTNATSTNAPGFPYNLGSFLTNDLFQSLQSPLPGGTGWPVHSWSLSVSNRVTYAMLDANGRAYDFVNLGPFGTTYNLTNMVYTGTNTGAIPVQGSGGLPPSLLSYWNPNFISPALPSIGVLNQISNGITSDTYFASEIKGVIPATNLTASVSNLYFSLSNDPAATYPENPPVYWGNTLIVNDPLVHYTVGDLTSPTGDTNGVNGYNDRIQPWPYPNGNEGSSANMTLKDPNITGSDDWNFPAGIFPSVGALGRVHRGTPWQTIFLKADGNPAPTGNPYVWATSWVSTMDTYPTNDYALLDLFTAAPSDNAARGLLSVNQMNDPPWYAALAGLVMNTNIPTPGVRPVLLPPLTAQGGNNPPVIVDPTNVALMLNAVPFDINTTRSNEPDGVFHNMGSVFKSPVLTIANPLLLANGAAASYRDEQVEAIPQQVAGLLKVGQPQFVIYCYGQALKPKDIYFGPPPNFNLCTNYQITGEYLTRVVCHVVGDPAAANVKIQVDSINNIPAD